jgi:PAS domain S-box-containing protein
MDMPERAAINAYDVIRRVTESSPSDSALVSLRELDALFDQAPVAMTFLDRELRVRRTSAAFRRLVSLPDEAILGRRPSEFDHGVDAALIERTLAEQVIKKGVPMADGHVEPVLAGERRVLSWSAHPVTENGRVLGALCCFEDVTGQATSLRQAHALLERAGHQIGTTLDIHRTAAELAGLAVPELADRVTVDLCHRVLEGEDLPPRLGSPAVPPRGGARRQQDQGRD